MYQRYNYVKANIEAKIMTKKSGVIRASFTEASLSRIRAILFPGYASFCSRLSWRENVPYTRTMGTRWSNIFWPARVWIVEYVWPSAINSPRMDVSSSNVFPSKSRRENTWTSLLLLSRTKRSSSVPFHCARSQVFGFDEEVSVQFLYQRTLTWITITRLGCGVLGKSRCPGR